MWAQVNELLFKKTFLILGFGRLVTTEYRVLPSIWYSDEQVAEPIIDSAL